MNKNQLLNSMSLNHVQKMLLAILASNVLDASPNFSHQVSSFSHPCDLERLLLQFPTTLISNSILFHRTCHTINTSFLWQSTSEVISTGIHMHPPNHSFSDWILGCTQISCNLPLTWGCIRCYKSQQDILIQWKLIIMVWHKGIVPHVVYQSYTLLNLPTHWTNFCTLKLV